VAPSGRHTESKGEVLDLLLATHVPNLEVTEERAVPASVCHAKCFDWRLAARVVTYKSVEWMQYSCPCCKRDGGLLSLTWSECFYVCLDTGHVPTIWLQVKLVFIPKADRNSCIGPRPINLTSFLLKTMERLVDRFLRDQALALVPLHPNQHCLPGWEILGNGP